MKFFLFLFLFTSNLGAQEMAEILTCQDQIDAYGSGKGIDEISFDCVNLYKKSSSKDQIKVSKNLKMKIYAYKNMIIEEKESKVEFIAGLSTLLNNIKSIEIDEKKVELIVTESDGRMLYFTLKYAGNIAPFREKKGGVLYAPPQTKRRP